MIAENLCRHISNVALQACRDAGNPNVPLDELLIPIPPKPSSTAIQQWISTFNQLSPNSQAQGSAVLETLVPKPTVRPNVAAVSKVLFDSSKELPSGSGIDLTYNFGIHSFIQDLLNAGQYCPLTLFTNQNMEHLHCEGHALKRSKVHVNGISHHLLDLSQFENELDLDLLSWQEAYQCYLTWIEDIGDPSSLKCWTAHFTTLSKKEAVQKNFRAIIEFNIEKN
ncbi:hypothetical protein BDR03DRAFT_855988 [Suillus americanus]|nr:hypothetical protein BDR03DRAFT_855988 [Suillus americanus]